MANHRLSDYGWATPAHSDPPAILVFLGPLAHPGGAPGEPSPVCHCRSSRCCLVRACSSGFASHGREVRACISSRAQNSAQRRRRKLPAQARSTGWAGGVQPLAYWPTMAPASARERSAKRRRSIVQIGAHGRSPKFVKLPDSPLDRGPRMSTNSRRGVASFER